MKRDIDSIIDEIRRRHPEVVVRQLDVKHPADDAGLWFFRAGAAEVQLESIDGACPFLVESDCERRTSNTVEEALNELVRGLALRVDGLG